MQQLQPSLDHTIRSECLCSFLPNGHRENSLYWGAGGALGVVDSWQLSTGWIVYDWEVNKLDFVEANGTFHNGGGGGGGEGWE